MPPEGPPRAQGPGATAEEPTAGATETAGLINGRYRLVRELGQGGMGSVSLVLDVMSEQRPLALKRVRNDRLDRHVITILRNEFLALAALKHPGLAQVYDFGVDGKNGDYYFTSEFVDGVHLLKACRGLDLSREDDLRLLVDLVSQILRALEFIHSRGLVHGDIKPENILVAGLSKGAKRAQAGSGLAQDRVGPSERGGEPARAGAPRIKLIDFGLTRREKEFGGKKILGTTFYIAPETISGSQMDRRTDLYSLGCVLYHLLVGRPPFTGDNNLAILRGHLDRVPEDPSALVPSVPQPLSKVVLRLLEKKPQDRFPNALEVIQAIGHGLGLEIPLETHETRRSYLEAARPSSGDATLGGLLSAFTAACNIIATESDRDLNLSFDEMLSFRLRAGARGRVPQGRLVILRGEKGLGKRRLIGEFKNLVQVHEATFLSVECGGRAAVKEPAEGQSRTEGNDAVDGQSRTQGRQKAVDSPAPSDPAAPSDAAPSDAAPPRDAAPSDSQARAADLQCLLRPSSPPWSRLEAFIRLSEAERLPCPLPDATTEAVRELSAAMLALTRLEPVVIHFHDLHRAKSLTMAFIRATFEHQVARTVPENQLLLTATAGDQADVEGSELHRFFRTISDRSSILELNLSRLDRTALAVYLLSICPGLSHPSCPGKGLPDALLSRLLEESDGNPEVVAEIVDFLMQHERLQRTATGWTLVGDFVGDTIPGRVRQELRAKIDRLPAQARRLALAFSVLGNSTELEVASQLAGLSREDTLEGMKVLHRQRLLEEDNRDGRFNVYSFVHASAQDILYQQIPPDTRRSLHDLAGRLLIEYCKGGGKDATRKIAVHFLKARNREEGIRHGVQAARALTEEFELRRAIDMYSEVLLVNNEENTALAEQVQYEIACIYNEVGEYQKALDILLPLAAIRTRDGRPPHPTMIYVDVAKNSIRLGELEQAARYLEKAAASEKSQLLPVALVHVLVGYADLYSALGRHQDCIRYAEKVLEDREQIHDKKLLVRLYTLLAESHDSMDQRDRSSAYCQEALKVVDVRNDNRSLDAALFLMGLYFKYKGKYSKAVRELQLAFSVRKRRELLDGQAQVSLELGSAELSLEMPRRAVRVLKRAQDLFERTGNQRGMARTLSLLGEAHALLGEYEDSRKAITESLRLARKTGDSSMSGANYLTCAKICTDQGDHGNADKYLAEVESAGDKCLRRTLKVLEIRCQRALECGRYDDVFQLTTRGIDLAAERKVTLYAAPFLEKRALVELRLGNRARAKKSQETLLEISRRHGLVVSAARARMIDALICASTGKQSEMAQALHLAAKTFLSEDTERDLIQLYLEYGAILTEAEQLEHAFLYVEEANYLVKKLSLSYWKCRAHYVTGLFELKIADGDLSKARDAFLTAQRHARHGSYLDVLWQSQYHLAWIAKKSGRQEEAAELLKEATSTRQLVLDGLPRTYRDGFLNRAPAHELDLLREEYTGAVTGMPLPREEAAPPPATQPTFETQDVG